VWAGTFTWAKATFVALPLVALALLLAGTRRAVRRVFIDLKHREELSRLVAPRPRASLTSTRAEPGRRAVDLDPLAIARRHADRVPATS
jgi:hypothetical protein